MLKMLSLCLKKCFIFLAVLLFAGCASTTLVKNQVSSVSGTSVTYVFEKPVTKNELGAFNTFTKSKYIDEYTNLQIGADVKAEDDELLVTRWIRNIRYQSIERTVNEYKVKVVAQGNSITLTPFQNRKHQGELLALSPLAIPEFSETDLTEFLSASMYGFKFEVDSEFPSESVNANFKRLASRDFSKFSAAEKVFENSYFISMEEADAKVEVSTYPYRNGSKCTISVKYITKANSKNVIVLKKIEEKLKAEITKIVNA